MIIMIIDFSSVQTGNGQSRRKNSQNEKHEEFFTHGGFRREKKKPEQQDQHHVELREFRGGSSRQMNDKYTQDKNLNKIFEIIITQWNLKRYIFC